MAIKFYYYLRLVDSRVLLLVSHVSNIRIV